MKLPSGKEVYPSTKITENFTWGEATKDCTRIPPSIKIEENIINCAINLQKIRDRFKKPIIITSWYRDPESNRRAGGASNSMHLRGYAVDFKILGLTPPAVYGMLANHPGGLAWYRGGWNHIDWRNWDGMPRSRWTG